MLVSKPDGEGPLPGSPCLQPPFILHMQSSPDYFTFLHGLFNLQGQEQTPQLSTQAFYDVAPANLPAASLHYHPLPRLITQAS